MLCTAIAVVVAWSRGSKVTGASRGGNLRTRWWTPEMKGEVELKKESYKALLVCGIPDAAHSYWQGGWSLRQKT